PLGIGVQAISFRLITRVLQDNPFSAFWGLPLLGHALVPSGFRLQVSPMTQKPPSEFLLTASGIQHRVLRRTVSEHTVPQITASLRACKPNAWCARRPAGSAGAGGGNGPSSSSAWGCGDRATSASAAEPRRGTATGPPSRP